MNWLNLFLKADTVNIFNKLVSMTIEETHLKGSFLITPRVFKDSRGYFFESYNENRFRELTGLQVKFVQDNLSKSDKGVLRGLHFQTGDFAQAKLVKVVKGSVLDVIVDLRPDSNTYGAHYSVKLDDQNKQLLFVPRGFAHGFLVLEDNTVFSYLCDNFYNAQAESGIIYNDPELNIDWGYDQDELIISEKDLYLPTFERLFQ